MKAFFLCLLTFLSVNGYSQKGIHGLIHAERSFARYTVQQGIPTGFSHFLDKNGIVFNGAEPKNGIQQYKQQPLSPTILNWGPEYAVISASQDFGFTTGPYHVQRSSKDSVSGRGQYSSVWHIDEKGEWKVLIDLGVRYSNQRNIPESTMDMDLSKITVISFSMEEVQLADEALNRLLEQKGGTAVEGYLTTQSWFNTNGQAPLMGARDIFSALQKFSAGKKLAYTGGGISSAKDLAFTYGKLMDKEPQPYLRIWTKQKTGWILLLQVMNWYQQ
jgi:hypothetical protein